MSRQDHPDSLTFMTERGEILPEALRKNTKLLEAIEENRGIEYQTLLSRVQRAQKNQEDQDSHQR